MRSTGVHSANPAEEGYLMAYIRRLPSGKWQAMVRGPDGRKHTRSDPLKKVVSKWATDTESKVGNGDVRDPRAGEGTRRRLAQAVRSGGRD